MDSEFMNVAMVLALVQCGCCAVEEGGTFPQSELLKTSIELLVHSIGRFSCPT
jgi:hypothetical protein